MNVTFDRSFLKSRNKLSDAEIKKTYYRIRLGDYRVGVELEPGAVVRFIIVAHRKDIYRLFP